MNKIYPTFDDLVFEPHELAKASLDERSVLMANYIQKQHLNGLEEHFSNVHKSIRSSYDFKNGYSMSVIQGPFFKCDKDTYEVCYYMDGDTVLIHNDNTQVIIKVNSGVSGFVYKDSITTMMKVLSIQKETNQYLKSKLNILLDDKK